MPQDLFYFLEISSRLSETTRMNRRAFVKSSIASGILCSDLSSLASVASNPSGIHPPDAIFLKKLSELMELANLPGLGIGIIRPGQPLWEHYEGIGNLQTKQTINSNSVFPGCSLGKPIFACVVLKLAEEGKIDLDRPLNLYLQDDALSGEFGDKVTARHVLTHSTGLYNWRWAKGQKLTPTFEPGTRFRYSGEGFYHLQRVVEKITEAGFESTMQERIFKPLGMTSSTYLWHADTSDHLVAGHNGGDPMYNRDLAIKVFTLMKASPEPLSWWTHDRITEALVKAGNPPPEANEIVPNVAFSLLTTVRDYSRFLSAFLDPGNATLALSPAMRSAMEQPHSKVTSALSWGLGVGVEQTAGRTYLWQWGDNGGWKDFLLAQPATRSGVVVFTNGNNGMHVNERIARATTGVDHPIFLWV